MNTKIYNSLEQLMMHNMQRIIAIECFAVVFKCAFHHNDCQSQPQSFNKKFIRLKLAQHRTVSVDTSMQPEGNQPAMVIAGICAAWKYAGFNGTGGSSVQCLLINLAPSR